VYSSDVGSHGCRGTGSDVGAQERAVVDDVTTRLGAGENYNDGWVEVTARRTRPRPP
jgi:hypothetical protein